MKFGHQFALKKNTLWVEFYLNYDKGKQILHAIKKLKLENKSIASETKQFAEFILEELKKCNDWYTKIELQCLHTQKELREEYSQSDIYDLNQQFTIAEFSELVVSIRDFATINEIAFTKIIKKFDKTTKDPSLKTMIDECTKNVEKVYFKTSKEVENILTQIHPLLLYGKIKPPPDIAYSPILQPEDPIFVKELSIKSLERNKFYHFFYQVCTNSLGNPIQIPIIVARGRKKGPILCITSALHGNEINGIPLIHKLMSIIDTNVLIGTVVCIPVLNSPGYLKKQKNFTDGVDLDTIFPGNPSGGPSEVYVSVIFENIIKQVEYLIDLQTAEFGKVNSLFAFANMKDPITSRLAYLQSPQIIVHDKSQANSLRGAATKVGIKAITLGLGNPLSFQKKYIKHALIGVQQIMGFLKMIPYASIKENLMSAPPTICTSGIHLNTDEGGVLTVFPEVNIWVKKGEIVARVRDLFGNVIREYKAPLDGIVLGKNHNPAAVAGEKILFLGLCEQKKFK